MNATRQAQPLTLFWKLIITLSAVVGVGTCAGLWLIYTHFLMATPGTMAVLERQLTKSDAIPAIQDEDGEAVIRESRKLASYESMTYYAAPARTSGVACLVGKYDLDQVSYWEACDYIPDGRDILAKVQDPDGRDVLFVPDQFDHGPMERDGWVTLHRNLLVMPLTEPRQPQAPELLTRNATLQKTG